MSNKAVEELTLKMGGLEISMKRRADSSYAEEAGESVPLAGPNAHCLKHPLRSSPWIYSAWSICKSSCQLSSRPSREGAVFAAEAWIAETMDDEAAGDYVSCEEAAVMEETAEPGIELGHVEEVERLQAHIQDLELQVSRLSQQQSLPAQPAAVPQATVGLLGAVPKAGDINAQEMQRLRDLAGAGPARLRGPQEEGDPCETRRRSWKLPMGTSWIF